MVSTKNYYPRPNPPDIQYEERSKFRTTKYNGDSIYEWNIDGNVPYRFKLEKNFTISTNYPEVFEKYLEGYYMSTGAKHLDIEADEEYNDDHYWETMGPEEMSNIENMMEG